MKLRAEGNWESPGEHHQDHEAPKENLILYDTARPDLIVPLRSNYNSQLLLVYLSLCMPLLF